MRSFSRTLLFASLVLCEVGSFVAAHGHGDSDMSMDMDGSFDKIASNSTDIALPSYFRHPEHSSLILGHIVLMSFAWVIFLPLVVMFSIARSRLSLPAHFGFLVANTIGLMLGTAYSNSTPDLYPGNAHHTFGWLLTWITFAQAFLALVNIYSNRTGEPGQTEERVAFIPISAQAMAEHEWLQSQDMESAYRFSNDSGQGTERNTESLRSQSLSSAGGENERQSSRSPPANDFQDVPLEKHHPQSRNIVAQWFSKRIPGYLSSWTLRPFSIFYEVINRVILILGFVAIATGFVTYGGIFRGGEVFSGLAHFIKGSVFLWYGVLTLGRWAGSFADLGWAWNIRPSRQHSGERIKFNASAEFVESFLIFLYGSTNVFLEHLGKSDGTWSAQDLEHVSITIMFFGGGLCGMLIESSGIRDLLNASITSLTPIKSVGSRDGDAADEALQEPPKSYKFSMNPLPALIVLLLGIMMSSHHQQSMVSTMVHKQWGTLLMGASFARGLTYIIFYIAPPTSSLPSRPPSELITSFCLMAGGFMFMVSSHDTVNAMESNDLDAMFVFTVTMGLVTIFMAWIILVIALKGWALSREKHSSLH